MLRLQNELNATRVKRDAVASQLADYKDAPAASAPATLDHALEIAREFVRRSADAGARFKEIVRDLEDKLRSADKEDRGPLAQQLREWRERLDAEIARGQSILKALQLLAKKTDPSLLGDTDQVIKQVTDVVGRLSSWEQTTAKK